MSFIRNVGEAKGAAEGFHCVSSSSILLLVCLLFVFLVLFLFSSFFFFFLSIFVSLCVRFLLLLHLREQLQYEWNIVSCLFPFAFVCSRRSIVRSFVRR